MYELIKFLGLIIRQFLLPNPFESIWPDYANILNVIMGILLLPVSYAIVGLFYKRHRDGAAFGSFMFNAIYIGLSFIVWGGLVFVKLISDKQEYDTTGA